MLVLPAPSARAAVGGATLAGVAAAAGARLAGGGPLPGAPTVVVVLGASVAIAQRARARGRAERDALRTTALSDPLTGAANRRALSDLIAYEVSRHVRQRRSFAVVMLDLDGFKLVNDRFGHPAGDELLRDVARALERVVRDQDTLARLGGDEFCVLAPETDRAGGERLASRAQTAVARVTAGIDTLSASVGVALFPDDGADSDAVLGAADAAQRASKRRHRASVAKARRAA